LAFIALLDGFLLFVVMRPTRLREVFDFSNNSMGDRPKGTPIWRLLMDPYIAVCAGALAMVRRKDIGIYLFLFIKFLFKGKCWFGFS
jgi:hypothetical protein